MMQADLEQELKSAQATYPNLSGDIIASFHRYVTQRVEPGGFLTSVLENNLAEAVGRADHENIRRIKEIVTYVYMQLPSNCWKSKEAVRDWLKGETP